MAYVIVDRLHGRGYVAPDGSEHAYVRDAMKAKKFSTREAAEKELCVDNECVVNLDGLY
jgi:hypothetical protein